MLTQIKILTKLELCNLYGLNVLRFSKDKKAKHKAMGMLVLWLILLTMLVFYIGGFSYGFIYLGLDNAVPIALITISSLFIFISGILKTGVMFQREGYDILCALPLPTGAVVASRLLRMYVENMLLALAVWLPGIAVYAWNIRPGVSFYLTGLLEMWCIPLIPMSAAILTGTLITAVSSRMRYKSLIASGLSVLAVLGVMYGSSRLSVTHGKLEPELLKGLSASMISRLRQMYPPAVWMGSAITDGDMLSGILCVSLSLAIFTAVAAGIAVYFHRISQRLYSSISKYNYQVGTLKSAPVLASLCKREFRRYFSSSVYVTNTMIGPIMGCVLSAALFATGTEAVEKLLPIPVDVNEMIPFAIAGVFCMMTITATSVSMEGKNWWIVKSLPLSMKNILDAKLFMNLLLLLPFYLLSELLLIFAFRPGAGELLWFLLIPAVLILFSCVYGITINLHLPVLDWENEVYVVKQSASSVLGGMGGPVLAVLCMAAVGLIPREYTVYVKIGICTMLLISTAVLYYRNVAGQDPSA